MADTADRYRRLATAFTDKVAAVAGDAWESGTPCGDWTARDLVSHVAATNGMFLGFVGRDAPERPDAATDPLGAWVAARDAMQAALDDTAVASEEFEGALGKRTLADAVDQFLCTDLVVHNWDLSRGTGQDESIDPGDASDVIAAMEPLADLMRSPQAFGPEIEPPPGADAQTRMLCFLGRQP